ncbi:MAG: hypothetical protein JRJ02_06210, partial [Deltaproteobacteria bacterium]|nr:hypothetical protein [Deltaproteobacteria bacterium]
SILPAEGFEDYESPEKSQSVPFDFIATKDNKLALIEMKGAGKNFNYSSATQYSRLLQVYEALEKDNIKPSLFLLQINLKYGVYQILTKQYYDLIFKEVKEMMKRDPELGRKQKIDSNFNFLFIVEPHG